MNRTDVLSLALKLTTQNREHEHGVFRVEDSMGQQATAPSFQME